MGDILSMIQALIDKGYAYQADNGLLVDGQVSRQLLQHMRANGG